MTAEHLSNKWKTLPEKADNEGFKSLLLSPDVYANVFIGVNNKANRCLILALPKSYKIDIRNVVKENLTIEYFPESHFIVLQLIDNSFYDLFDDLILSVLNRIKDLVDVDSYAKEFIHTFYKWSEFFDDKKLNVLSDEALKGIVGELIVLKGFVSGSDSYTINDVLESWKGPYDQKNDFVFSARNIEVKAKDVSSVDIKISSEHQLEPEFEKGLELLVISLKKDIINGVTLKELVLEIRTLIIDRLGDTSILFKALIQKGLSNRNLHEYDHSRFLAIEEVIFDCTLENFPKLTRSNIPAEISNLRYNLKVNSLAEFIISQKLFNHGNR